MTPAGIAVVARQELTIRIRTGRWRWLLLAWFTVLMLFTLLMRASIARVEDADVANKGVVVYGALSLLVLALALLVVPALAAQSVNGDRERGTLATLQVTRLTAGDIALGKLAAAWGVSLVFLALTLPMVGYSMILGGVTLWRVVVVTLVVTLLLGSVVAMALCLSTLLSRTTTSGVLAYLVVFVLTVGTLISFAIGTALTRETVTRTQPAFCSVAGPFEGGGAQPSAPLPAPTKECFPATTYQSDDVRTDHTWWLLAPNPFVILADSAPQLPELTTAEKRKRQDQLNRGMPVNDLRDSDPLGAIGRGVRDLRLHPGESYADSYSDPSRQKVVDRRAVWPYGLAFDVLLGIGAMWLTAHKLKTPTRNLPRGQRVA